MKRTAASIRLEMTALAVAAGAAPDNFKYESRGKRDPFVPLVGQAQGAIGKLMDVTSADDLRLEGIALGGGGKNTAIINRKT